MCRQAVKPKSTVKAIEAAKEGQKLHSDFGSVRPGQVGDMFAVWCVRMVRGEIGKEEGDTVKKEVGLEFGGEASCALYRHLCHRICTLSVLTRLLTSNALPSLLQSGSPDTRARYHSTFMLVV